ncbi:hypothetical protein SteCoe_17587 [Stentor coeruleus]|uniref:EF-hand domain-containing protein n=1 Tax=Stentor coeruleus TaxID=5963 RepID=A0A1R2BYL3_9CILI|nr:hypothetical protein SteCoe_17587 [Stentor coeruleus]
MGCVSARENLAKEEVAIILMENQLEFFKNNSVFVDGIIRKYSQNNEINESQWKDIYEHLEIKVHNTSMCPLVENFYNAMKTNGLFYIKDILIVGILLSNGMSRQKARLIFETFDSLCTGKLEKEDLGKMLDEIYKVSVLALPSLVNNSTNPPASHGKVKKYIKMLQSQYPEAKSMLIKKILEGNDDISVRKFAKMFDNEENGRLLTPCGFRTFIDKLGFADY